MNKTQGQDRTYLLAGLIVLAALGLRLWNLGGESLWIDEGFSLRDSLNLDLLGETRPLYFALLAGWMKLVGTQSEFLLRLPSALFGAAGVWMLFLLGRRLAGAGPALLASFFMAVSVLQINHSREIRMYSLTVLLVLGATYLLVLALERGKTGYMVAYALTALAGLLTFPLTVLILIAHGLFLLLYAKTYRPKSLYLIGSLVIVAAVWLPWLYNNMQASTGYSEGYASTLERPTPLNTVAILGKFFLWKWNNPGTTLAMGALIFSGLVALLALYSLRGLRRSDPNLALILLWLGIPVVGMIALSYGLSNMWMVHYLIGASPAFFLLLSKGVFGIRNRYAAIAVVLVITVLTLGRLGLYFGKHARPEWQRAVTYIEQHERPGDVIGIHYGGNQHVFRYYYHGKSRWSPLGRDEITKEHFTGWNDARASKLIGTLPFSGKRFWLVLSNHDYAGGSDIVNYVQKRYRLLEHKRYSQIEVLLLDAGGRPIPDGKIGSDPIFPGAFRDA